ncbi:hypothetical protein CVT25_015733 [Psilocybe cyanescens]|uniref:Cyclin N-terminal domain-containing protein n=1 Tax=Psilocybe cyanescens TaxID=93625 RepID=A0A409WRV7_PSICY|nr:hypothetical protein CVT25_015733 [Psilocybe cyanescens]
MASILYPLASVSQIEKTPSREDGIPEDLEEDLRAYGCKMIHEAGILLKQKQVAVAAAQILFQRFWFVTSMKQFGVGDVGMGALYLASKLEECPLRMRDLINVYDLLLQRASHALNSKADQDFHYYPMSYFGSTFYELKDALVLSEMQILKRLGFNVHVVLPYGTLISYLRILGLDKNADACTRAWGYLNDAQSPNATRHLQIPLPSNSPMPWWELFDTNWEDVWSVSGHIMRLYRERTLEDKRRVLGMVTKKEVRRWLEGNSAASS